MHIGHGITTSLIRFYPLFDITSQFEYPIPRPGRPGAAMPFETRQDRKIATARKSLRAPPVACLDIIVYNSNMTSSKLIKIAIAIVIGITLGLLYGWVVDPIEYTDVPPNILREDYRVDYVLMVAEAYQNEVDPETAVRRLAILGSESPAAITVSALEYANHNGFTQDEILALQNLLTAVQTYQPQGDHNP